LPTVLERIAMATSDSSSAVKLGKRRASNTPLADVRPAKKTCGAITPEKQDDDAAASRDFTTEDDDSEAEREEVQQCLLRPVTPSPAASQQEHRAIFTAFSTVPRALSLPTGPCSQSPSPSPTPARHNRKRKRKGVFMDAVEVPTPKPQRALRKTQPRRRCASLHMMHEPATTTAEEATTPLLPPPSPSSGPAVRRSLRRAKSLGDEMSAEVPVLRPAPKAGKRQRLGVAVVKAKTKSTMKNVRVESDDIVGASADPSSSSPFSASLKQARVLFGSGKSPHSLLPRIFGVQLIDGSDRSARKDDSMAAETDLPGGAALSSCASSDDDPRAFGLSHGLGRVTAHQLFSPPPRCMSSRFFAVHDKA
jgi:hypothetical protein